VSNPAGAITLDVKVRYKWLLVALVLVGLKKAAVRCCVKLERRA
jgi:hypothetical protein